MEEELPVEEELEEEEEVALLVVAVAEDQPPPEAVPDKDQLEALQRAQATKKQDRYRESLRTMTMLAFHKEATVTAEEAPMALTDHESEPCLEYLF